MSEVSVNELASLFDHLFVALFAIVYPAVGFVSFRRLLKRVALGQSVARLTLYDATIVGHWLLFAIAVTLWTVASRDARVLGFGLDVGVGLLAAGAVTVAGIVMLVGQLRFAASADADLLERIERSFGSLVHVLPHDRRELARFSLLSMTAGIVEETLWRGYLLWYLTLYMPLLPAALLSTLGFGLAHAYQGYRTLPRITLVGGVLTGIYILGGSLWLPIVLHGAIDLLQGRFAYRVIRRRAASGGQDAPT